MANYDGAARVAAAENIAGGGAGFLEEAIAPPDAGVEEMGAPEEMPAGLSPDEESRLKDIASGYDMDDAQVEMVVQIVEEFLAMPGEEPAPEEEEAAPEEEEAAPEEEDIEEMV
tara:strand:- start:40 stop:381 length:342 start_codon:yes stop_codon:yes gene_type:complete